MHREDELLYYIWMAESFGAGSRLANLVLRYAGDAVKVWKMKPAEADSMPGLMHKDREMLRHVLERRKLDGAERILDRCIEKNISLVHCGEEHYPVSLRSLAAKPLVLYYKGVLPMVEKRLSVAVVGTRTMSDYGRVMSYGLGYGLASGGALVISGMALGSDSTAQMGALEAGGTVTAVLGSGVDVIYPREHTTLYHRILRNGGCILSEYAPGTEPDAGHFPVRNRIISGLSDAGVVVEADKNSGALITARLLIHQGRRLFAVPGQVGLPGSQGPNDLIRDGALPAVTAGDILSEFMYMYPDSVSPDAAHRACRNMDMDKMSRNAMVQFQIGVKGGKNYLGETNYGSRKPQPKPETMDAYPSWVYEDMAKEVARAGRPAEKTPVADPSVSVKPESEKAPKEPVRGAVPETEDSVSPAEGILERMMATLRRREEKEPTAHTEKKNGRKAAGKTGKPVTPAAQQQNPSVPPAAEKKDTEKTQTPQKIDTEMLDTLEMRVYNSMKPNVPMMPDELVAKGFSIGDVMAAMTVLEMAGAIEAGSGGYFLRTDADDMPVTLVDDAELERT